MKQICTETVFSNALVNKTVRLSLISRKTNAYAGVACNYMNGSDLELVRVKQVIIVTHIVFDQESNLEKYFSMLTFCLWDLLFTGRNLRTQKIKVYDQLQ